MPEREHYIPVRRTDLVELLARDLGPTPPEGELFRQFCGITTAMFHYEYHEKLEELKAEYARFNPDAETAAIGQITPDERQRLLERFYEKFTWLMGRANFRRLSREELIAATRTVSAWGLNLDVDFSIFDHLEVYVRGDGLGKRYRRSWRRLGKLQEVEVPVYRRLALILKQKKHRRFGPNVNTESVFLKLFKDIPKADIEMLIPGGRIKMPGVARGKLGASMLGALGFVGLKISEQIGTLTTAAMSGLSNPLVFWGPLSLVLGYGYKQWAGFQNAQKTYSLQLTQSLYYQTLDSNAGVLHHLLDEAEEQECRETFLGYYYLWRYAGKRGWTARDLDDYIERDMERLTGLKVDFEVEDALSKLEKLGIVEQAEGRYRAVPVEKAVEIIDEKWDNFFKFNAASAGTRA